MMNPDLRNISKIEIPTSHARGTWFCCFFVSYPPTLLPAGPPREGSMVFSARPRGPGKFCGPSRPVIAISPDGTGNEDKGSQNEPPGHRHCVRQGFLRYKMPQQHGD